MEARSHFHPGEDRMKPETNASRPQIDASKFENTLQIGGISTGTLDTPGAGGARGGRVAWVDTGAGLRFLVALDRGGDIVNATYNQYGLVYLAPNGLPLPNAAHHVGAEWLRGWPGGLLTSCGPEYIGGPRVEDGTQTSLHGRASNLPACVEVLRNPDPRRGRMTMELGMTIRDTRVFGPIFEIRRRIHCTLGVPEIHVEDEVTNLGDTPAAHHWLYHCNFGYPLVDEGSRFIYGGDAEYWVVPSPEGRDIVQPISARELNALKRVPAQIASHAGGGERGVIVNNRNGPDGRARAGLINDRLGLGIELSFSARALPRLAHWQHYGPRRSYASALEPFYGSLLGSRRDHNPLAKSVLQPDESRRYAISFRIANTPAALRRLSAADSALNPLNAPRSKTKPALPSSLK